MTRLLIASLLVLLPAAVAAQSSLPVSSASAGQIRIDGDIGEWRGARFTAVGQDPDGSAEVALAYDARGLYVGARVHDQKFLRSSRPKTDEDALIVRLAFPQRGQFVDNDLWLFAGKIGETAASAQLDTSGVLSPLREGVQIVEGPLSGRLAPDGRDPSGDNRSPALRGGSGGYVLEAFVPWTSFQGGADYAYARGSLRLHDVDEPGTGRNKTRDPSTAAWTLPPAQLPWLQLDGGPVQAISTLLRSKNLEQTASKLDFIGDVRGDARAERVVVIGTFVAVSGNGAQFDFADLGVSSAGDVLSAEARDLTGDGKPELVLRVREQNSLGRRELLKVFRLNAAPVSVLFGAELRKQNEQGSITAQSRIEQKGRGPAQIVLSIGYAQGFSADNYRETPDSEVVPIALPWGSWIERRYQWDGKRFAMRSEVPVEQTDAKPAEPPTAASTPPLAEVPESPQQGDPLEAYKRERNVSPSLNGRFVQNSNVSGDARPEQLAVYGRELVITGESLGGAGYFYLGLPVNDAADVLGLQTGDLTGDGRRELLVRVRQRIGDVERELVYCYSLGQQRADQLLVVEVSRARGAQRIDNKVAIVADKQRSVLTIEPGVARGWSASDYPFVADSADGVAPLLLPWKDRPTSYIFERDRLVPKATTSN
ncbi:MAG TPA: hypothetical protein VJV78_19065 [Polyangiales bacterium]|nr:hypothetical protein [Polyangiales bacterium]